MMVRRFAQIFGIIYLAVGILGFVPGLVSGTTEPLAVGAASGNLLGIFPVNAIHDLVHILIGVWGIMSAGTFARAQLFSRRLAVLYGVLTIAGLFPGLNTLFGLAPLYGPDIALHAGSALVAAYFGWAVRSESAAQV